MHPTFPQGQSQKGSTDRTQRVVHKVFVQGVARALSWQASKVSDLTREDQGALQGLAALKPPTEKRDLAFFFFSFLFLDGEPGYPDTRVGRGERGRDKGNLGFN